MECPRTGKNGGPARPAAGPSQQQGSRSMCALGPCSSESRAGQDAQWRGGALPVNSSCSMPTATVLPSSILVVATCREDFHQRGHQGEVLVLGVLGGRRRGVGHAHVVAAGGRCVSGGSWRPVRPPVRRGLRRPASEIRVRGCAARRSRRTGRPSRSSPPGTRRCPRGRKGACRTRPTGNPGSAAVGDEPDPWRSAQ